MPPARTHRTEFSALPPWAQVERPVANSTPHQLPVCSTSGLDDQKIVAGAPGK